MLLVVRAVENGRDALGRKAQGGRVLFAINRGQETIRLLPDLTDPRLAPFARSIAEMVLPPLTPRTFRA